jgi:hypothetical protein
MAPTLSFPQQAARASWIAPIIAVGFVMFSHNIPNRGAVASMIIGSVAFLFYIAGLVLAIIALAGMKKAGRSGVLVPALAGLVINGALVVVFASLLFRLMAARVGT